MVTTRRLIIELEVDSDPIAGRILVGTEPARVFMGWTALAGFLEAEHRHTGHDPRVPTGTVAQDSGDTAMTAATEPVRELTATPHSTSRRSRGTA